MAFDLSSIAQTNANKAPLIVIYGDGGIGKTTFASNAPNPVFIQTEQGEGSLSLSAFPLVTEWGQLIEAINTLIVEDHDFNTLVIDSLDHLEQRVIWSEVCRQGDDKGSRNSIEEFGFGKGYKYALSLWHQLFDGLQTLRREKNMAIILIAHCKVKRFDSPLTEPYDRYMLKMHDSASEFVRESVDAVLFAHEKTVVQKAEVGFNQTKSRGVSTGRRILGTTETAAYQAKNRYSLPKELDLDWSAFQSSIAQ